MATGQDPELVFTSVSLDSDSSRDLELTRLVLAASCWQCCTSWLNTARNVAKSGASSACRRSSRNMSSVRSGYSADWKAGVRLGCQAPHSKLVRVEMETIWVMVTDSTVDSGSTSVRLLHPIPRSPIHRLLADGLSQHGCRQVCDDHLAGKERHNYGHEMTPNGLPAALPGRLTESKVWSVHRIWPWMDS